MRKSISEVVDAIVRAELTEYYLSGESALGLSSSFGPLVDAALGGWGGSRDQEGRITDGRFKFGSRERHPSRITRASDVRSRLTSLPPIQRDVLFALFGSVDWAHAIDDAFGAGKGIKVVRELGDVVGVALLTTAVAEGFARDREAAAPPLAKTIVVKHEETDIELRKRARRDAGMTKELRARLTQLEGAQLDAALHTLGIDRETRSLDAYRSGDAPTHLRARAPGAVAPPQPWKDRAHVWDTPGGWLVTVCMDRLDLKRRMSTVRSEAEALADAATNAYVAKMGLRVTPTKPTAGDRRRARAPEIETAS